MASQVPPPIEGAPTQAESSSGTKASGVLNKYEEKFFDVVDAKYNLRRLKRKNIISDSIIMEIKNSDKEEAKEVLFEHLQENADVAALREYCRMIIATEGYPKMRELGKAMLRELPPEGSEGIPTPHAEKGTVGEYMKMKMDLEVQDVKSIQGLCDPGRVIKLLYINALSRLIQLLKPHLTAVKDRANMYILLELLEKEEVVKTCDIQSTESISKLLDRMSISKKWNSTCFLQQAVDAIPAKAMERESAEDILTHYNSHLEMYERAILLKDQFPRKTEVVAASKDLVPFEITSSKSFAKFTCEDCRHLQARILSEAFGIPADAIICHDAVERQSTTVIFLVPNGFIYVIMQHTTRLETVWTLLELDVIEVAISGFTFKPTVGCFLALLRGSKPFTADLLGVTEILPFQMHCLIDPGSKEPLSGQLLGNKQIAQHWRSHEEFMSDTAADEGVEATTEIKLPISDPVAKMMLEAATNGDLSVMQLLVKQFVNVEGKDGRTPLLRAAEGGHTDLVKHLARHYEGDIFHKMENFRSALHLAAYRGHLPVLRYLCPMFGDRVLDRDGNDETCLDIARRLGRESIVQYLTQSYPQLEGKEWAVQPKQKLPRMPIGLQVISSVMFEDKVYISGIATHYKPKSHQVQIYSLVEGSWSTLPLAPSYNAPLAVINGHVTLIGGRDVETGFITNILTTWSAEKRQWKQVVPPMPSRRLGSGICYHNNLLLVSGGVEDCSKDDEMPEVASTVHVYDFSTWRWSTPKALELPKALRSHHLVVLEENIYIVGGAFKYPASPYQEDSVFNSHSWRARWMDIKEAIQQDAQTAAGLQPSEPVKSVWTPIADPPAIRPTVVSLNNSLISVGGVQYGMPQEAIYKFVNGKVGNRWVNVGNMSKGRYRHAVVSVGNAALFVAGGYMRGNPTGEEENVKCYSAERVLL